MYEITRESGVPAVQSNDLCLSMISRSDIFNMLQ